MNGDDTLVKTDGDVEVNKASDNGEALAQAKRMGYREDYTGQKKLSPEEFIQRHYERLDIAVGTVKTLDTKLQMTEKQNRELTEKLDRISSNFTQFVEMSKKSEERAYQRAKKELEAKMEAAVEAGDTSSFRQLKGQMDDLDASIKTHPAVTGTGEPGVTKTSATGVDPRFTGDPKILGGPENPRNVNMTEWAQKNTWLEDDEAYDYAFKQDSKLTLTSPYQSHQERLDTITERVKKKFPQLFGMPAKTTENGGRVSAVEGSSTAAPSGGGKKKGYMDMPPEARKMCDELVADKIVASKDEYVKTYWGQFPE